MVVSQELLFVVLQLLNFLICLLFVLAELEHLLLQLCYLLSIFLNLFIHLELLVQEKQDFLLILQFLSIQFVDSNLYFILRLIDHRVWLFLVFLYNVVVFNKLISLL